MITDKDKKSSEPDKENFVIPDLQLTLTTYQLLDNKWVATVSHTFHGSTQEELFSIMEAHKKDDSFFDASHYEIFSYKGEIIYLKNSEIKIAYP